MLIHYIMSSSLLNSLEILLYGTSKNQYNLNRFFIIPIEGSNNIHSLFYNPVGLDGCVRQCMKKSSNIKYAWQLDQQQQQTQQKDFLYLKSNRYQILDSRNPCIQSIQSEKYNRIKESIFINHITMVNTQLHSRKKKYMI